MSQEVHYEIFVRTGAKGGWDLHDVASGRDGAIQLAEELMTDERITGVRVVKETYNPDTGDYLTLKVFEDGHTKMKVEQAAEDVPHALPCFQPEDLYSDHARSTIARLLTDFLARNCWTVTELIHRADALEKLEATGTLYQHAIQKISVAQASSTAAPVQPIMKSLNELATKAIHRVYRDAREKRFPTVAPGKFGTLATKLGEQPGPVASYILNGAIAQYLKPARTWDEKLARLLALMHDLPAEGESRQLLLSSIDAITAEILNGSAALHELIGTQENLGEALLTLVQLFSGQEPSGEIADHAGITALARHFKIADHAGITALARHFKSDELVEARTAIANRILAELRSVKRLSHSSMTDELKLLRKVANRLVLTQGKYLSHEAIIAAFTLRSRRLVAHEGIAGHLSESKEADEKIDKLLAVEENIIGTENKRQLATFLIPILQSNAFDQQFLVAKTPPLQRMHRLAELQTRVQRSGFQDKEKREIAELLDKAANEIEARSRVLETIESRATNPVERAIALLKLCTAGALTEGRLSARARDMVLGYLSTPGFLTGYMAHPAHNRSEKPDADAALKELMEALGKAGISAETGLKSLAA